MSLTRAIICCQTSEKTLKLAKGGDGIRAKCEARSRGWRISLSVVPLELQFNVSLSPTPHIQPFHLPA